MFYTLLLTYFFTGAFLLFSVYFLFYNKFIKMQNKMQNNFTSLVDENEKKNKHKSYYSLVLFSSKIKNYIVFFRIVIFRMIANILLINLIEKK